MNSKASEAAERLEKSIEIGTLCAFYGGLLTDKQLKALRLYYNEDYTLGEIAESFGVSRQNVHELITRSAAKLRKYEEAVGGVKRARLTLQSLETAAQLIEKTAAMKLSHEQKQYLADAAQEISRAVSRLEGEETNDGL